MVVHFFTALMSVQRNLKVLRGVMGAISDTESTLADDWISTEYFRLTQGTGRRDWPAIYINNLASIENADVVIAEVSGYSSFGVGFQVAAALHRKKPTLLLQQQDDHPTTGTYPEGIKDPFLSLKSYKSVDEAVSIVKSFIEENVIDSKDLRFNFVIDRQIYNHIRAKAFKTRKTKAEIVRELLLKDMGSSS